MQSKLRRINIASTLLWTWAAILLFSTIAMAIPMFIMKQYSFLPLIQFVLSILFILSAIGIRKYNRNYAILAIVTAVLSILILVFFPAPMMILGILICLTATILIVSNWTLLK
jgi:asparagine N-glycosylation enzyme membrane subunit Stt3